MGTSHVWGQKQLGRAGIGKAGRRRSRLHSSRRCSDGCRCGCSSRRHGGRCRFSTILRVLVLLVVPEASRAHVQRGRRPKRTARNKHAKPSADHTSHNSSGTRKPVGETRRFEMSETVHISEAKRVGTRDGRAGQIEKNRAHPAHRPSSTQSSASRQSNNRHRPKPSEERSRVRREKTGRTEAAMP